MVRSIRGAVTAGLLAAGFVGGVAADEPKGGKADPPGTPLTITVTGKANYTFDSGSLTREAYRKASEDAAKAGKGGGCGIGGRGLPAPPAVDLAVELKNTSDRPLTVWAKGDPVILTLNLSGKGAVNLDPPVIMT